MIPLVQVGTNKDSNVVDIFGNDTMILMQVNVG